MNAVRVTAGTYRLDTTVTVGEFRTLILEPGATLLRDSAFSAATTPVVRLHGSQQSALIAYGSGATVQSENASPRGVINVGPAVLSATEDIGWTKVEGIVVRGVKANGNIGICVDSSQASVANGGANTGSNYNGLIARCYVFTAGTGIKYAELANAHTASDNYFFDIGQYVYHVAGGSDLAHATQENHVSGGFTHTCSPGPVTILKLERATFCTFFGVQAEPGDGTGSKYYDIDSNSSQNKILGHGNMAADSVNSGATTTVLDRSTLQAPTLVWGTPNAKVYNSANVAIANATDTVLTFNGIRTNNWSMYAALSNDRLTVTRAGIYKITCRAAFAASAVGTYRQMTVRVNGSTVLDADRRYPLTGVDTPMSVSCEHQLSLSDYVQIEVKQDSGGNLNVNSLAQWSPEFSMVYVGSSTEL